MFDLIIDLIIVALFWVVLPLLAAFMVLTIVSDELTADARIKAHRKDLLEAIRTSNLNKEDKAEVVCKFVNCRRK